MSSQQAPAPFFSLFSTSRGGDPAVVVVNAALRTFEGRSAYPWHLEIGIRCENVTAGGLPTPEEVAVLDAMEDASFAPLSSDGNAVFLSRVTCGSNRELSYRVRDPEAANRLLAGLVALERQAREWAYRMDHDAAWSLAKPTLDLFERDRSMN